MRHVIWMVAGAGLLIGGTAASAKVDYATQIKPILEKACYSCHSSNIVKDGRKRKAKAGLYLDSPEGIMKGSEDGKVVVPGDPAKSSLYELIVLPADDEDLMPPEGKDRKPLSKAHTDLIRDWIAAGVPFGEGGTGGKVTGTPSAGGGHAAASSRPKLPEVAAAPAAAVKALQELGALAMPLAANTNLLNVDFRAEAGKITDAQLAALKPVAEQVAWLNLAGTKVTDQGLAQVGGLKNLSRLHLEKTGVGDAGVAHLKSLGQLAYLNLYGTQVSDAGLKHLADLENLEKLFVWQTKVTKDGAKQLKDVYVNTGWEFKPVAPAGSASAKSINTKCPVSGKAVDASKVSTFQGQVIGFCCDKCKAKFDKDPKALIGKVKEFKAPKKVVLFNDRCPISGKPVDPSKSFAFQGKTIGFCCDNCKGKFVKEPKKFIAKVKKKAG
ncbi:MAG: hypothetical protein OER86_11070 [Phycisphaerae bacterium]|nr:hypothetical protein [Phycisphaerae bacterium]